MAHVALRTQMKLRIPLKRKKGHRTLLRLVSVCRVNPAVLQMPPDPERPQGEKGAQRTGTLSDWHSHDPRWTLSHCLAASKRRDFSGTFMSRLSSGTHAKGRSQATESEGTGISAHQNWTPGCVLD